MTPIVPPASPLRVLLLGALLLAATGCGGLNLGGVPASYEITPARATVAPEGTVTLAVHVTEAPSTGLEFSVREGDAGGTVVQTAREPGVTPTATYTAPAKTGTYHVRVRILNGESVAATRTSTIAVRTGE